MTIPQVFVYKDGQSELVDEIDADALYADGWTDNPDGKPVEAAPEPESVEDALVNAQKALDEAQAAVDAKNGQIQAFDEAQAAAEVLEAVEPAPEPVEAVEPAPEPVEAVEATPEPVEAVENDFPRL